MRIIKLCAFILMVHNTTLHGIVIIGHRGASGSRAENTLSSFQHAIECNVDMIEFDVRKCASGELIVFHDVQLDRITNGHGNVELKTLDELRLLRVLGTEQIPTFTEVLDFVDRRVKLYIELKSPNILHDTLKILEHYIAHKGWRYDDFLIASFDHLQLQTIKSLNSRFSVAPLMYGIPVSFGACAQDIKAEVVCLDSEFINQYFVDDIHRRGMLVYVYTINNYEDFIRVTNYGVDGIITDYPDYICISLLSQFS